MADTMHGAATITTTDGTVIYFLLKTEASPDGLPIEAFDESQALRTTAS